MQSHPHKPASELFGVPAPSRNARDRLINSAVDLFYTKGFNAVGLDQVLAEVGVTKTTFYKHFQSKDDLMVAAVKQRDEWERLAWKRAVTQLAGDDPRAQLLAMFDVLDAWFNDPQFGGCLFINAAAEFPNPHDPIHQAAAAHKRAERDGIRDLAKEAGATDPERFADLYALLFEGTLVLRHRPPSQRRGGDRAGTGGATRATVHSVSAAPSERGAFPYNQRISRLRVFAKREAMEGNRDHSWIV